MIPPVGPEGKPLEIGFFSHQLGKQQLGDDFLRPELLSLRTATEQTETDP
jgi:hypothetical protein